MSEAILVLLLLLIFFILPTYLMKLSRKLGAERILSDIVICYGIGMILGNTRSWWLFSWAKDVDYVSGLSFTMAEIAAYAAVLLAIPLLLMVNNVKEWKKYTGKISIVFFLGMVATLIVTLGLGYIHRDDFADASIISGMLAGVYIGGTPNMIAVSKALDAGDELFIVLNATDTVCSALYFFFLISIGKIFIRKILPRFVSKISADEHIASNELREKESTFPASYLTLQHLIPILKAIGIAILLVLLSVVPALLFPNVKGELNQAILMLSLSTMGIALSFIPTLRLLPGVFPFAQYLLLIFGLAAGFLTEFGQLAEVAGSYFIFNALVLICMVLLHLTLSKLIRSDADSFMISSIALIMGPPFVAQMASALKNKELLPVGIALSLLGFALANYAGILVAWLLSQ
jgi:uncharacterized membrane protein